MLGEFLTRSALVLKLCLGDSSHVVRLLSVNGETPHPWCQLCQDFLLATLFGVKAFEYSLALTLSLSLSLSLSISLSLSLSLPPLSHSLLHTPSQNTAPSLFQQ